MSKTYLMIFAALVSASLVAQTVTNPPASPPIEAPAVSAATNAASTNISAAKKAAKKKKSEKKAVTKKKAPAAPLVTTPLNPGPAVCEANNVNVRGQAKLKSEVVGKLTKGQQVTVLEEIHLKNSAVDEPSAWAKISLPTNILVWVNTSFIDPANKTVKPRKLNVRGGPGENYSVLGTLKQGDAVKDVSTKGDWTQIEPPADAYAFVAAQFLKQGEAPTIVAANTPTTTTTTPAPEPAPPTTTTTVKEPTIASAPTEPAPTSTTPATTEPTPTTTPPSTATEPPVTTTEPSATTTNTPPEDTEPPPKRIVQREGIVRGTFSIQAPTRYELINPDNHKAINYLFTDSPDLDLSRYKGIRIIVTGEEGLDERWRNTPVITIQKIQVLDYGG